MRLPTIVSLVCLCLLIALTGTSVLQGQTQGLNKRESGWDSRSVIRLPGYDEEDDDGADDEYDDEADDEECDCPPPDPPAPVLKTGKTECLYYGEDDPFLPPWDNCSGTGRDGEHQMGISAVPRFTGHGDGTVTDNLTGLIWLQDANCFGLQEWENALSEANGLADGACGLADGSAVGEWRLPNVRELHSLIDFGRKDPALPRDQPFSGVQSAYYWSSSGEGYNSAEAWRVDFAVGTIEISLSTIAAYVLPVRGGTRSGEEGMWCAPASVVCDEPPPDCGFGMVPLIAGGCWGECVSFWDCLPIECETDADCPDVTHCEQGVCDHEIVSCDPKDTACWHPNHACPQQHGRWFLAVNADADCYDGCVPEDYCEWPIYCSCPSGGPVCESPWLCPYGLRCFHGDGTPPPYEGTCEYPW